jgi:hypothetical protein
MVFACLQLRSSLEALLRVLNEFHVYFLELMPLSLILFPCHTDLPVQLVGAAGESVADFLEEGASSLLYKLLLGFVPQIEVDFDVGTFLLLVFHVSVPLFLLLLSDLGKPCLLLLVFICEICVVKFLLFQGIVLLLPAFELSVCLPFCLFIKFLFLHLLLSLVILLGLLQFLQYFSIQLVPLLLI